eukprot:COSAG01_NODE_54893_length_329_cov_0.630435_1_plen_32_part_01
MPGVTVGRLGEPVVAVDEHAKSKMSLGSSERR